MNFKEYIYNETSSSLDLVGYHCRKTIPSTDPYFGQIIIWENETAEPFVKRYIEKLIDEKDYYEFREKYGDDPEETNSKTMTPDQWKMNAAKFLNEKGYRMLFCADKPERIYGRNCYAVYVDKTKIINITRRDYPSFTNKPNEITEETVITWKIPYNPTLTNIRTLPKTLPQPIPLVRPRRRLDPDGDHDFL